MNNENLKGRNDGTLRRIDESFTKELDLIKKLREKKGMKKVGDKQLTRIIPKHDFWEKIKKDLIRFPFSKKGMNKRGLVTLDIFMFMFLVLVWVILIGIYLLIFNLATDNLDVDIEVGQVNFGEIVQSTFGQINTAFVDTADVIGFIIIFGMIITMFANAYLFRGRFPKMFIIVDIILLVFAYILAVYISNSYEILITSTSVLNIYINDLSKASGFILNLPKFVGIIGMIIMILSYSGFPRDTPKEALVGELA